MRSDNPLILVVDDDPDWRETLVEILDREGYRVRTASNGREALALLSVIDRPHAVVTDLRMPQMSGWDLVAALRATPETAEIPVVVASASSDRGRGNLSGVVRLLSKPVTPEALLAALADCCAELPVSEI